MMVWFSRFQSDLSTDQCHIASFPGYRIRLCTRLLKDFHLSRCGWADDVYPSFLPSLAFFFGRFPPSILVANWFATAPTATCDHPIHLSNFFARPSCDGLVIVPRHASFFTRLQIGDYDGCFGPNYQYLCFCASLQPLTARCCLGSIDSDRPRHIRRVRLADNAWVIYCPHSLLTGTFNIGLPSPSVGTSPARILTCKDGIISFGISNCASRSVRNFTNSSLVLPAPT